MPDGTSGNDNLVGTELADSLYGQEGNDTLNGMGGDDYLNGGAGVDIMLGGDGDDDIWVNDETDGSIDARIDGGAGTDYLSLARNSRTTGVVLSLANPTIEQNAGGTIIVNIERLDFYGGSGDDIITGGALNDRLYGNGGNDVLTGGGGDDILGGWQGNDTLDGGAGNDTIDGGAGNDSLSGGDGDDTIQSLPTTGETAHRDVLIDGGAGSDYAVISKTYSTVAITLNISDPSVSQTADGTVVRNIERMKYFGGSGIDTITGGALDDFIYGAAGNDVLSGGGGNDEIDGEAGNDTLNGGAGDDRLFGSDGNDVIRGDAGNDIITGDKGADSLEGGDGDDILYSNTYTGDLSKDTLIDGGAGVDGASIDKSISTVAMTLSLATPSLSQTIDGTVVRNIEYMNYYGGSGVDTITGGLLNDNIYGNAGNDILNGGAGNDRLEGGLGNDTLDGGDGLDVLVGFDGTDTLRGGLGNDTLNGEKGADSLEGGDGDDILLSYTYEGDITKDTLLDGGAGTDYALIDKTTSTAAIVLSIANPATGYVADGTTVRNIERIDYYGGSGADSVTGGALNDQIYGNAGNDTIDGGGGDDVLQGGSGTDALTGAAGADKLDGGSGSDSISGGDGDDFIFSYSYSGDTTKDSLLDGGSGKDYALIDKTASTAAITFSIANPAINQVADGTTIRNIEQIDFYGGSGVDTVTGGDLVDNLFGNGGNDVLAGGAGDDLLYGVLGDDRMTGGAGNDKIDGGEGSDTVTFSGAKSDYEIMNYGAYIQFRDLRPDGDGTDRIVNTEKVQFSDGLFDMATVATRMVRPFVTDTDLATVQSTQAGQPSMTYLAGGGYVVVYTVPDGGTGYDSNIVLRIFDANDNLLSTQTVNSLTAGSQSAPVIQATANGGFIVAWHTYVEASDNFTTLANDVKAQLFDAAGAKVGTEFKVSTASDLVAGWGNYDMAGQSNVQMDLLANGNVLMVWKENRQSGNGTSTDTIRVQIFDPATGAKIGTEFTASTSTSPYQPDVAVLANGTYVVTWLVEGGTLNDGSGSAVKGQLFTASGTKIGTEFLVNTTTVGYQGSPKVAALGDGGFVVVFGDGSAGYQQGRVLGQIFNSSGAKVGGEFKINSIDDGDEYPLEVTSLSTGGFVVTYAHQKYVGNLNDYSVLGQAFSANGVKIGHEFTIGDNSAGDARAVEMPNGDFAIVYRDYEQGVIVQKYSFIDANVNPTFKTIAANPSYTENGGPIALTGTVTVDDWSSENYKSGSLTITVTSGGVVGDVISLETSTVAGSGVEISGNEVKFNNVVVGTATMANGSLTISFNEASNDAAVKAITEAARFSSTSDNPGTSRTITFTLVDGGGVANGGSDTTSFTRTVAVTSVNDLPVGTDGSVTFNDNAPYVLKWADFGYSDPESSTGYVIFTAMPTGGQLVINGSPVSIGSAYQKSIFDAGQISFRPNQGTNDFQASLSFRVMDQQGGQDATPNVLQLNVTAVNDVPVATISNLARISDEINISGHSTLGQSGQQVAAMADGSYMVVWTRTTGISSGYFGSYASDGEVQGQLFSASGQKIGAAFTINTATNGFQDNARIVSVGDKYLVVWADQSAGVGGTTGDTSGRAIKAQFITADGAKFGPEMLVNTATAGDQAGPEIVKLAGGGFAIAWHDYSMGVGGASGDSASYAVKMQFFNAAGAKVGTEQLVNTATVGDQYFPEMTALKDGGVVVVWQDRSAGQGGATGDTSGTAIKAQFYSSSGTKIGGEILVNTAVNGNQDGYSVLTLADGKVLVTWTDNSSGVGGAVGDSSSSSVKAQLFSSAGAKIGAEILVNTLTASQQSGPQAVALPGGGFAISWTDNSQNVGGPAGGDNSSSAVKLQLFDASGAKVGGEILVNTATASAQNLSSIATLSDGGFVITWNDISQGVGGAGGDTSQYAVKAQIFSADGDKVGTEFLVNTTFGNNQLGSLVTALPGGGMFISWGDNSVPSNYSGYGAINGQLIGGRLDFDALQRGAVDVKGTLSLNDPDAGSTVITVTLAAAHGTLSVSPGTSGATVLNSGTSVVTLSGTLAQINALLRSDPTSSVIYTSPADVTLSNDHLTLGVIDNGIMFSNGSQAASTSISITTYTEIGTAANETLGGSAGSDSLGGFAGDDILDGAAGSDYLAGGDGNDTLIGGAGNDLMTGGAGDDIYFVDATDDLVVEATGQGTDRVVAFVSYSLTANAEVETLETHSVSGTSAINLVGSNSANSIIGNNGVNFLYGNDGNDTLHAFGGNDYLVGGTGLDNLYGGQGDDRYYIGSADGDRIWESAGEGYDTVSIEFDYELPDVAHVERLEAGTLSGTAALALGGSNLDNLIIGNAGNNRLRGFAGDDTLHGLGGDDYLIGDEGADVMYGGTGNDTYYVNTSDDRIFENAGEGTNDRVATEVSFTLPDEAEVELLEAVDLGGTSIATLGGSRYANIITGDAGNNLLRGYGGNDTLTGHLGNDTLIGDEGNDTMIGGQGNDTYYVDAAGDVIIEEAGQGTDRVSTSVSYALSATAEVESLEVSSLSSTDAINLTGSNFANTIIGNNGANVIDGKGGNDVLIGAGGADTFAFTTAFGVGNVDRIEGFEVGVDKIALDDLLIGLNAGSMDPNRFVRGSAAKDADDRIIYNPETGALMFDADGSGSGAAVQIATLGTGLSLGASDLLII